jgi:arylformamidase
LLEGKVLIIEGLDLSGIEPGQYTLYCLPLNIPEAEGAPARVLLGR